MKLSDIRKDLKKHSSKAKANVLQGFFKTGKGEYGEGDKFIGVVVPDIRKVALKYQDLGLGEVRKLLRSPIHEERLLALIIMVYKFKKAGSEAQKKVIFKAYLANTKYINNWDLVDLSSHEIVGQYLADKPKKILYNLSKSNSLWERRIAVVSNYSFIRNGHFGDICRISKMLLKDKEDLIHKACGWMLREVGKRDLRALESFLKAHYKSMPRTMLRYAIELLKEPKRQAYLKMGFRSHVSGNR